MVEEGAVQMTTCKLHVTPGYARRWFKRNWCKAVAFTVWLGAGILIRETVAATRAESWQVGSEIIPAGICWFMALRVALSEKRVR